MNFEPPPPPPDDLSSPVEALLAKGVLLHRVWNHLSGRAGNVFNPGYGDADPTRFAPLHRPEGAPEGSRIGTLYAGETFAVAAYETLFRDLPPRPALRDVAAWRIDQAAHCTLTVGRDLRLASLHHRHLGRWGLSRSMLIECLGRRAYAGTVLWAEAIHDRFPHIDGLVWTSRQDDSADAYLFFGDRVQADHLVPGPTRPLGTLPGRTDIELLANQDEITITRS